MNLKERLNRLLIKVSIRPYKAVELETGIIINHYRNGKLKI